MDTPSEPRHLGDYLLKKCVAQGPYTRTWLAEQQSVRRTVWIEELRPDHAAHAEAFLAEIRADFPQLAFRLLAAVDGGQHPQRFGIMSPRRQPARTARQEKQPA